MITIAITTDSLDKLIDLREQLAAKSEGDAPSLDAVLKSIISTAKISVPDSGEASIEIDPAKIDPAKIDAAQIEGAMDPETRKLSRGQQQPITPAAGEGDSELADLTKQVKRNLAADNTGKPSPSTNK